MVLRENPFFYGVVKVLFCLCFRIFQWFSITVDGFIKTIDYLATQLQFHPAHAPLCVCESVSLRC